MMMTHVKYIGLIVFMLVLTGSIVSMLVTLPMNTMIVGMIGLVLLGNVIRKAIYREYLSKLL